MLLQTLPRAVGAQVGDCAGPTQFREAVTHLFELCASPSSSVCSPCCRRTRARCGLTPGVPEPLPPPLAVECAAQTDAAGVLLLYNICHEGSFGSCPD